jgi:hypothetical protein
MDLQGDMKMLIHVGVELVVMAGLAFWMNKRIGVVESGVQGCMSQMKKYEEILAQQSNVLSKHDAILRQIFGGGPPPPDPRALSPPPGPDPRAMTPPHDPRGMTPPPPGPDPRAMTPPPDPTSIPPPPGPRGKETKKSRKGLKEVTPDDLDKMLQEELKKERKVHPPDFVEVDTKLPRRRLKGKKKE